MSRDCPPHHSRPDSQEVWVHHDCGGHPPLGGLLPLWPRRCGQAGSRCSLSLPAGPCCPAPAGWLPPALLVSPLVPVSLRSPGPAQAAPSQVSCTTAPPVYLHLAACCPELKSVGVGSKARATAAPTPPCWLHPLSARPPQCLGAPPQTTPFYRLGQGRVWVGGPTLPAAEQGHRASEHS